jgi:hypothetical protein
LSFPGDDGLDVGEELGLNDDELDDDLELDLEEPSCAADRFSPGEFGLDVGEEFGLNGELDELGPGIGLSSGVGESESGSVRIGPYS